MLVCTSYGAVWTGTFPCTKCHAPYLHITVAQYFNTVGGMEEDCELHNFHFPGTTKIKTALQAFPIAATSQTVCLQMFHFLTSQNVNIKTKIYIYALFLLLCKMVPVGVKVKVMDKKARHWQER